MAADPIWASVNTDGTFVSPKVQAAIDARTKATMRADLEDALADLPSASVSHIAVTDGGRLAHRAGGTTTLTTTTSGRLAVVRA